MSLGTSQTAEPPPEPITGPAVESTYKSVSNKYVDITFDKGIYVDNVGVDPVTASNFSIIDFVAGGVTNVAIASVKINNHYTSASATALIGGDLVVRVFITLTGTPDGTESFRIRCTDIFSREGISTSPVSATCKINITPLMLWDVLETAAVVTTSLGVSQLTDVMGVANFTQSTDANRPVDGGDSIGFVAATPNHMTAGDVGALDFQKGDSFTVFLKRLNSRTNHTGFIISNRTAIATNRGWSISVGSDGSLFFVMHDGTLQGFVDYDAFSTSGERNVVCVNNNGTLNVYNDAGTTLGTTGNATGIGTISYTGANVWLGRRQTDTNAYFNGSFEKIAIVSGALTSQQRADFWANMDNL